VTDRDDIKRFLAEREATPAAANDRYAGREYDFAELIAGAELEPPWRAKPLAADGHLTVLAARGGDGKTWLGFAMAAGVAYGTNLAGLECTQGNALLFDAENGRWVLGSRLKALEEGLPPDRVSIHNAEGLRLTDPEDLTWMASVIRAKQAHLVIIDALRPMAPDAEENSADDMAPVVIATKQLARDTGAATVLLHHRGNDDARDFRGSTTIRDQTDILYVLERLDKDPERKWRRRLRCGKCRIAAEPPDHWLGIRSQRGAVYLTEAAPPDQPGRPATARLTMADNVLDLLRRTPGLERPDIARALGLATGHSTLRRALTQLTNGGSIVQTPGGAYWPEGATSPSDNLLTPPPTDLAAPGGVSSLPLRGAAADNPPAEMPAASGNPAASGTPQAQNGQPGA
jgi:hypothetical protein